MTESPISTVRPWTRVQDWIEVIVGAFAALSPLWFDHTTKALWTLVILGALIAIDGLWSLAMPDMMTSEGVQVVLGVLLFISPWVLSFSTMNTVAWTAWLGGALTVVIGGATMQVLNTTHRQARLGGQH